MYETNMFLGLLKATYLFLYGKKWQAQIKINGKYKFLGRFNNIEDAVKSRDEGKLKYHRFVS